MHYVWFMAIASIVLASAGQLLLKYGLNISGLEGLSLIRFFLKVFTNPYILSGVACYFISMSLWLLALRNSNLSLLYPMVSLSYVIVAAGSVFFLGETLPPVRIIGMVVIVAGVSLVAR